MAPPARNVGAVVRSYDGAAGWLYKERRYEESVDTVFNELHAISICLSVRARPAPRTCPPPVNPRVFGLTAQVAKKKGVRQGPMKAPLESYSFGMHYVLNGPEQIEMWTEKPSHVPKAVKDTFAGVDFRGSPMLAMTQMASAKDIFLAKAHAGEIGPEYIGNHGVGGLLWPPLEYFDEHVRKSDRTFTSPDPISRSDSLACPLHPATLPRGSLDLPLHASQLEWYRMQPQVIEAYAMWKERALDHDDQADGEEDEDEEMVDGDVRKDLDGLYGRTPDTEEEEEEEEDI